MQCCRHLCPKATGFWCLMRQDLKVIVFTNLPKKIHHVEVDDLFQRWKWKNYYNKKKKTEMLPFICWIFLLSFKGFFRTSQHFGGPGHQDRITSGCFSAVFLTILNNSNCWTKKNCTSWDAINKATDDDISLPTFTDRCNICQIFWKSANHLDICEQNPRLGRPRSSTVVQLFSVQICVCHLLKKNILSCITSLYLHTIESFLGGVLTNCLTNPGCFCSISSEFPPHNDRSSVVVAFYSEIFYGSICWGKAFKADIFFKCFYLATLW